MLLVFFVLSCADYERDNVHDRESKKFQDKPCGEWNFPNKKDLYRCNINKKDSIIEKKCGSSWYDTTKTTLRCQKNVLETKCGSGWYDNTNTIFRCESNVVETKCGSGWYDASKSNFECQDGIIKAKCGNNWYDAYNANLSCQNDVVVKKCGSNWYDTTKTTLRCQNNVVEARCGYDWYNDYDANLRCQNNVIMKKCGSDWYDRSEENYTWRCQNNVLNKHCHDDEWFNGTTNYCSYNNGVTPYGKLNDNRNGKTYNTFIIDDQIWMAENLNYNSDDSKCYNNETNCNTYGRLYDWYDAKTICPSGWRLPENNELANLMYYITDDYSFAPPLGGRYTNSFSDKDNVGFWWSITPGDITSAAYGQKISFEDESYSIEDISLNKSYLLSVRCIKKE
jgi:hypothetical protein